MSKPDSFGVAGVDGCKAGWCVAVACVINRTAKVNADCLLELVRFFVAGDFAEVLAETESCELVCVDIPIGLSDGAKPRECDIAARKILGTPRASSVFPPPVRQALLAKDRETASKINFKCSGRKLTCQSFNILEKIRQVDGLMTPELQSRVREIHPEVSFCALNGGMPLSQNKKTVNG